MKKNRFYLISSSDSMSKLQELGGFWGLNFIFSRYAVPVLWLLDILKTDLFSSRVDAL